MEVVLFACVHNAGRSQMAAAWFNAVCATAKARAISAGTQPAERVHPEVQQAMHEVGIDLSSARPQFLSEELAKGATLLVTMGCGDACPFVPGLKKVDWHIEDPKGQSMEQVRRIRDEIRDQVATLAQEKKWLAA